MGCSNTKRDGAPLSTSNRQYDEEVDNGKLSGFVDSRVNEASNNTARSCHDDTMRRSSGGWMKKSAHRRYSLKWRSKSVKLERLDASQIANKDIDDDRNADVSLNRVRSNSEALESDQQQRQRNKLDDAGSPASATGRTGSTTTTARNRLIAISPTLREALEVSRVSFYAGVRSEIVHNQHSGMYDVYVAAHDVHSGGPIGQLSQTTASVERQKLTEMLLSRSDIRPSVVVVAATNHGDHRKGSTETCDAGLDVLGGSAATDVSPHRTADFIGQSTPATRLNSGHNIPAMNLRPDVKSEHRQVDRAEGYESGRAGCPGKSSVLERPLSLVFKREPVIQYPMTDVDHHEDVNHHQDSQYNLDQSSSVADEQQQEEYQSIETERSEYINEMRTSMGASPLYLSFSANTGANMYSCAPDSLEGLVNIIRSTDLRLSSELEERTSVHSNDSQAQRPMPGKSRASSLISDTSEPGVSAVADHLSDDDKLSSTRTSHSVDPSGKTSSTLEHEEKPESIENVSIKELHAPKSKKSRRSGLKFLRKKLRGNTNVVESTLKEAQHDDEKQHANGVAVWPEHDQEPEILDQNGASRVSATTTIEYAQHDISQDETSTNKLTGVKPSTLFRRLSLKRQTKRKQKEQQTSVHRICMIIREHETLFFTNVLHKYRINNEMIEQNGHLYSPQSVCSESDENVGNRDTDDRSVDFSCDGNLPAFPVDL